MIATNDSRFLKSDFFKLLSKESKIALVVFFGVQFFILLFYALEVPLHYDEWYSYRNFSSKSLSTIVSSYPAPNNHVFYNVISHLFLLLPFKVELAMRLPSLLAALLGFWYLFKVCKPLLGEISAWLVLLVYCSSYNVLLYAIEARGYSFLNLFTILLLYKTGEFTEHGTYKKAIGFILIQAFGLYTVPTFIYVVFSVNLFLFFWFLIRRQYKQITYLLLTAVLSGIVTVGLYLPILLGEDAQTLLHGNTSDGKFSMSAPGALESILYFLNKMYLENLGISRPFTLAGLILVLIFISEKYKSTASRLFQLAFVITMAPFIILLLHHYFAYGRNWMYLCVPASVLIGLVPVIILHVTKDKNLQVLTNRSLKTSVLLILFTLSVLRSSLFGGTHQHEYSLDYNISYILEKLPETKSIARTNGLFEYYPADVLQASLEQRYKSGTVAVNVITDKPNEDLLIIAEDQLAKQPIDFQKYTFCFYTHNMYFYTKLKID